MLQFLNVSKAYSDKILFSEASFTAEAKERIALVGRNGYGKSTIFRMILGLEKPDEGEIQMPRDYRVGSLPQKLVFTESTVLREAAKGLTPEKREQTYRVERLLSGLGFTEEMQRSDPQQMSGGYALRIELAKVLAAEPDMLLLDEPTNYLDILSVRWLDRELRQWSGELILISHDRGFLNQVSTHSMIVHRGQITKVAGSVEKLLSVIQENESAYERTRINEERERKKAEEFIRRFRAQASKAALVQSKVKELERKGEKNALALERALQFSFRDEPFRGKALLESREISFAYPNSARLFENLDFVVKPGDVVGVIGQNGKGKSTLLKLLAGQLAPSSGSLQFSSKAKVGHFAQTNVAQLNDNASVEEEIAKENMALSRTQVRDICGQMLFSGQAAEKKIGVLSGGEKSRVLLGQLLASPLNLLLLDEPTSHLDIESVEALTKAIEDFAGGVVVVTHSEIFLRQVANRIIVFQNDVVVLEGGYDYFLEKLGWSDEEASSRASDTTGRSSFQDRKSEKKAARRLRARVQQLEGEFEEIEQRLQVVDGEICSASQVGDFQLLASLAESRKQLESRLDAVCEELDGLLELESSSGQ